MKGRLYMNNIKLLELDKYEIGILINALYQFRNKLLREDKDTELIDKVLTKTIKAPDKKKLFLKKEEAR